MPNWCYNTVTIIVDPEYAEHVKDLLKDDDHDFWFSLNKIHPRPTVTNPETGLEEVTPDWWDWSIKNWGTKWDVECDDFTESVVAPHAGNKAMLRYSFDSAWAPPLQAMVKLSELLPYAFIHIAFDEPGMDFSGAYAWFQHKEIFAEDREFSIANALHQSDPLNVFDFIMEG